MEKHVFSLSGSLYTIPPRPRTFRLCVRNILLSEWFAWLRLLAPNMVYVWEGMYPFKSVYNWEPLSDARERIARFHRGA